MGQTIKKISWLVVHLPLWKIWGGSWDSEIPNVCKNQKCSEPPTRIGSIPLSKMNGWDVREKKGGLWLIHWQKRCLVQALLPCITPFFDNQPTLIQLTWTYKLLAFGNLRPPLSLVTSRSHVMISERGWRWSKDIGTYLIFSVQIPWIL